MNGYCLAALGAALALLVGGCGGSVPGGPSAGARAPGGALSVEQALAADSPEPLLVTGALFAVAGEPVRLCAAMLESYPPQCGGPSLIVEEVDLGTVAGLRREGPVVWSDQPVELLGVVRDGVLTVGAATGQGGG